MKKIIKYALPYGFVRYILLKKELRMISRMKPDDHWKEPVRYHNECIVLAGGPSVNAIWNDIVAYAGRADVYTVNNTLKNEHVRSLRPVGHAMIDPVYFDPHLDAIVSEKSDIKIAQAMLAQVDWPMTLYVFPHQYEMAVRLGYADNSQITLQTLPAISASVKMIVEEKQYRMMDRGILGVGGMNVPAILLHNAVVARYKKVWLAGLDMTYLQEFLVDKYGRLFFRYSHFYENDIQNIRYPYSVGQTLQNLSASCFEYYLVQRYAESRGVQIVNLSQASLCDAFPKGSIIGEELYENSGNA